MAKTFDQLASRAGLVEVARQFYRRGWMPGTAGNLSVREEENSFWITASGLPKGELVESDFIRVSVASGQAIEQLSSDKKPSAETTIHRSIYTRIADARACLHVHTVDGIISVRRHAAATSTLRLPALEMIKGFDIWDPLPQVDLPIFENHADVPMIAAEIDQYLEHTKPRLPALMIRDHGVTVWGKTLQEAFNRVEIMEYFFSFLARVDSDLAR